MRKRSKIFSLIIMLSMLISSISTVYAQVSDVEKHWAKEEISYMLDKGFLTGYPDGTFRPEDNISKAEFYRVINNLMGYEEKAEFRLKDVKSVDWFYNDVAKGIKAGYLVDSEFLNPKDFITREEVARIIGIAFKLSENAKLSTSFKDYDLISPSAAGFIGALKDKGYIAGFPDGNFGPLNNIKRSEVVKMLYNVLMVEGMTQKVDLTAYKKALDAVKQSDYTKESWTAYQKVVLANVVTEKNSQEEVKVATATIIAAQIKLVKVNVSSGYTPSNPTNPPIKVDKTALVTAITQAQAKIEGNYTPGSWEVFAQALQVAVTVNSNSNATQEQVNTALTNLTTTMNALVEKTSSTPAIVSTFNKSFLDNFGNISVEVQNIEGAAKFDVVYHLSDNPDGSDNIKESIIADINQKSELIFYDPSQHNTITVRIYDINNNLLHTFKDVIPVMSD